MPTVKLQHFVCPGAENDSPMEGWEVMSSELPEIFPGDFLIDLEELETQASVVVEEELSFDPWDLDDHPF